MESLQQFCEEFIEKLMNLNPVGDFSDYCDQLQKEWKAFAPTLVALRLEELDDIVASSPELRKDFKVHKKGVERTLLTKVGEVQFYRRYYRHKNHGYAYLVDELCGIESYERIDKGLAAQLVHTATDTSYAESSERCCDGSLTRQSVMRCVRRVHEDPVPYPEHPLQVTELHLQCDEDHVAMQNGRNTVVNLCTIHTPRIRQSGKRYYLPNKFHIVADVSETAEDFWYRIYDEMLARYDVSKETKIYIHGDGGAWIKRGLDVIPNSRFVLDKFHLFKALKPVSGGDKDYYGLLCKTVFDSKPEILKLLLDVCVEDNSCSREVANDFWRYYQNNYQGIRMWREIGRSASASCAEGQVSHVLSARLSDRPKAWMPTGLSAVSRLRVHVKNGGTIEAKHMNNPQAKPASWKLKKRDKQRIQKKVSQFTPMPTNVLRNCKRQSAYYRLYEAIKAGGFAI